MLVGVHGALEVLDDVRRHPHRFQGLGIFIDEL